MNNKQKAPFKSHEDGLSMLRTIRIVTQSASLGATLEPVMRASIEANAAQLAVVPGELIRAEFELILVSANPLVGLDLLMETGLMRYIIPELLDLDGPGGDQDPIWHPEGNVWAHTRLVVQGLIGSPFVLVLGGLLHDIGKPATQERWSNGRISNHGHAEVGAQLATTICRRLGMSAEEVETVSTLVAMHMVLHCGHEIERSELVGLLTRPDAEFLIALQHADAMGKDGDHHSLRSLFEGVLSELRQGGDCSKTVRS